MSVYHMQGVKATNTDPRSEWKHWTLCGKHPLLVGARSFITPDRERVTCKKCLKEMREVGEL